MRTFSKAEFEPLVGLTFTVHPNGQRAVPLRLTSIDTLDRHPDFECFTLNLDPLDDSPALPDDTYRLHNEQWGEAEINISATPTIGPEPGRFYYEAVFNIYVGEIGKS